MKTPPTTVKAVENWFLNAVDREAGDTITHLKLQKLLYFAQAWYLANEGKPLFDAEFEAWAHGPVVRSIFDTHKGASWQPLPAPKRAARISEEIESYLEEVFAIYGKYSAKHLEGLTHKHKPWKDARKGLSAEARCDTIITQESMRDFYGKKIGKTWK